MSYEWTVHIQNILQVSCIYAENLTIMFIYRWYADFATPWVRIRGIKKKGHGPSKFLSFESLWVSHYSSLRLLVRLWLGWGHHQDLIRIFAICHARWKNSLTQRKCIKASAVYFTYHGSLFRDTMRFNCNRSNWLKNSLCYWTNSINDIGCAIQRSIKLINHEKPFSSKY